MSCRNVFDRWRRVRFEPMEDRLYLAAVAFASHDIECCAASGAWSAVAADLDGDGDLDVLSASGSDNGIAKVAWYQNIDGKGSFGQQRVISSNQGERARSVAAADVDADGDLDVVATYLANIVWYENIDGQGGFGRQSVIVSSTKSVSSMAAADVDGDGDLDVVATSSSYRIDQVAWYENRDGKGTFESRRVVTAQPRGVSPLAAVDLDSDGDVDVLSTSTRGLAWFENTDGDGNFGPPQVVTRVSGTRYVTAADVDGDGDLDALSASGYNFAVSWYENMGDGVFGPLQVIARRIKVRTLVTADFDGDGDVDLVYPFFGLYDGKLVWRENTDGKGSFGPPQVIAEHAVSTASVDVADVDGDGDLDVLSALPGDGRIAWYERRLLGDANDDGVFDSSDLVRVLQAGEYEDGIIGNSTFDDGDWNGDGEFDSADLVMAFQAGHYEPVGRLSLADVAAAVDGQWTRREWSATTIPRLASEDVATTDL